MKVARATVAIPNWPLDKGRRANAAPKYTLILVKQMAVIPGVFGAMWSAFFGIILAASVPMSLLELPRFSFPTSSSLTLAAVFFDGTGVDARRTEVVGAMKSRKR